MWAKMDADLDLNPKIRKGGRLAREVFAYALRVNARTGHTGRFPADHLDADIAAPILMMSTDEVREGFAAAVRVNLLALDGAEVRIVGWDDDEWGRGPDGSLTEKERKRRQREAARASRPSGQSTQVVHTEQDMSGHPPDASSHVSGRPDHKIRGEERRQESGEGGFAAPRHEPAPPASAGAPPVTATAEIDTTSGIIPLFPEATPPGGGETRATLRPVRAGARRSTPIAASPHFAAAMRLWTRQENARRSLNPRARVLAHTGTLGAERIKRVVDRLADGWTEAELEAVVDAYAAECRVNAGALRYFDGETNWRPANVDRTFGRIGAPRGSPTGVPSSNGRDHAGGMSRVPNSEETRAAARANAVADPVRPSEVLAELRAKGLTPT